MAFKMECDRCMKGIMWSDWDNRGLDAIIQKYLF